MKHKLFATFISLSAAFGAVAQTERHISLDEAVQLSLTASNSLRLSRARITEATSARREAVQRRLPSADISGSYLHILNTDAEVKLKLGNSGANSGGSGSGSGTTESGSTTATPQNVVYGLANVSLPVFTGFKIQSGIESAKYLEAASKLDIVKDRQDIIINTTAAYINLYKASEAVRIVRQNLTSAQSRVKDFASLEQNGLLARNDLLKAQLQQSNIELSLLDAENNLAVTSINMDLMLGLPEDTRLQPDETFAAAAADGRTLAEWESTALRQRSDLQSLDLRGRAAEQGIRSARSDYFPSVALTAGYIGAYVENVLTVKDAVNAGVGIRYNPLAFVHVGSNVATARARLETVHANQAMLVDAIRVQIVQAYQAYLLAVKKIDVYGKAVEQSEENYRIINNKYGAQLATATEVLDADVAQLQARLNYAFSKADASLAYQRLLQAAGAVPDNIPSSK